MIRLDLHRPTLATEKTRNHVGQSSLEEQQNQTTLLVNILVTSDDYPPLEQAHGRCIG